jgi:peroxiredoxin
MDRRILFTFSGILLGAAFAIILFYGLPADDRRDSEATVDREAEPISSAGAEALSAYSQGVQPGQRALSFTLQDVDGNAVSLEEYRGQVVLLNFWATWCGPCRLEMPTFQQRYEALREDGFTVLAVNYDESEEQVRAFREELGLIFPLLLDPGGEVQRQYRIRGYPTSVLIDRAGGVHQIHVGFMSESELDNYLDELGLGR